MVEIRKKQKKKIHKEITLGAEQLFILLNFLISSRSFFIFHTRYMPSVLFKFIYMS
jgi:hypothetical protein